LQIVSNVNKRRGGKQKPQRAPPNLKIYNKKGWGLEKKKEKKTPKSHPSSGRGEEMKKRHVGKSTTKRNFE